MEQAILVYVDLEGVAIKVGRLWGHYRSGRESMSCEYLTLRKEAKFDQHFP